MRNRSDHVAPSYCAWVPKRVRAAVAKRLGAKPNGLPVRVGGEEAPSGMFGGRCLGQAPENVGTRLLSLLQSAASRTFSAAIQPAENSQCLQYSTG